MLVVEDDRSCQLLARRLLTSLGHTVDIAADGLDALARLEQIPYDIVWMDIGLPALDGIHASRLIRERYPTGEGPYIIAFTAHALNDDKNACLQAGMNDYVSKPYRKEDVVGALARYDEAVQHQ